MPSNTTPPAKIFQYGGACDVAVYVESRGKSQVWDFLKSISKQSRTRFIAICELLAKEGSVSMASFKPERGEIWGIKLFDQNRIACFKDGEMWVCTHGFHKNGKWREEDFTRAENIRADYLRRK